MGESGVRQIKRSIFIDMRSIKFPDKLLVEKLAGFRFLKEHFDAHDKENIKSVRAKSEVVRPLDGFSDLTNLGLFRIYAESYLKNHPLIDKKQTLVIRHKESVGNGLPLQIYAFSNNNSWVPYENLQSEIVEHLLAVINEFELKVFQQPTGDDIRIISGTN
jgi:miniconductance mechanosensitive channel